MRRRKQYPKVTVKWRDAASEAAWVPVNKVPELGEVTTSGYLIRKDKNSITVCGSVNETGEVGDCVTIPKPWVIE